MIKFEEALSQINTEILKRRSKWTLTAIPSFDFDDVSQIIRVHIWRKWKLYDQSKPLLPWVNRVITHQMLNIIRNLYGAHSRPCLKCPANEGNDLCFIYGKQCPSCPLFNKWLLTKKSANDIKFPVALENHSQEVFNLSSSAFDIDKVAGDLHNKMKTILKGNEWIVYKHLYIDFGEESALSKKLGYKTNESGRISGYKTLFILKRSILEKVKKVLRDREIDIY